MHLLSPVNPVWRSRQLTHTSEWQTDPCAIIIITQALLSVTYLP